MNTKSNSTTAPTEPPVPDSIEITLPVPLGWFRNTMKHAVDASLCRVRDFMTLCGHRPESNTRRRGHLPEGILLRFYSGIEAAVFAEHEEAHGYTITHLHDPWDDNPRLFIIHSTRPPTAVP